MNRSLSLLIMAGACVCLSPTVKAAESAELEKLQGKWECKKTDENGQKIILVLEINKEKLTFRILNDDRTPQFIAKAEVKFDTFGPFKAFTSKNIKAGTTEDSLESVDEEYSHVYQVDGDIWYVTMNFDKQRERPPAMDVYRKTK